MTGMSQATRPSHWVSNEQGTFDSDVTCPHCSHGTAQVLGGGGTTVRCRCAQCGRAFLHLLWGWRDNTPLLRSRGPRPRHR
jgi:DNA-directed RNA polymerase subunit RPC12/RpoP